MRIKKGINSSSFGIFRMILLSIILFYVVPTVNAISQSVNVNVIEMGHLEIAFVQVDDFLYPNVFSDEVKKSIDFMNKTYPLSDKGLIYNTVGKVDTTNITSFKTIKILSQIRKSSLMDGNYPDVSIGLVASGSWFGDVLGKPNIIGLTIPAYDSVLSSGEVISSHEVGHKFGLCDEYDSRRRVVREVKSIDGISFEKAVEYDSQDREVSSEANEKVERNSIICGGSSYVSR